MPKPNPISNLQFIFSCGIAFILVAVAVAKWYFFRDGKTTKPAEISGRKKPNKFEMKGIYHLPV